MELDKNVVDYVKEKEPVMGITSSKKPYIGFTYPKTKKQIQGEYIALIKQNKGLMRKTKMPKPYINGYVKYFRKSFRLITEYDKEFAVQNFRYGITQKDASLSIKKIKEIMSGNKLKSETAKGLFLRIKEQIKQYCFLNQEAEYAILSIYIMLTYKYLHLDFMPIIHLNGEPGTGKSQVGKICFKLAFNSSATVSATKSSFFRRIDRKRGFYFMDEKETLQDYEKELLNGCTYEGNIHTITEKQGDNFVGIDFQIYAPLMLACVNDIYGATSTRTIKIETTKPPIKSKKYPVIRLTETSHIWDDIKDDLVLWSISTYTENAGLLDSCQEYDSLIHNRGVDSWKAILNMSKKTGCYKHIHDYIKLYYLDQIEESYDADVNFNFLKYLLPLSCQGWISAKDLFNQFCAEHLTETQRVYFSYRRFGMLMRRIGYNLLNNTKRRIGSGFEYLLDEERTLNYLRRNYEFIESCPDEKKENIIEEVSV